MKGRREEGKKVGKDLNKITALSLYPAPINSGLTEHICSTVL